MVVGLGIDLVDVARIKKAIDNDRFTQRVFTPTERQYCDKRGQGAAQSYAARFAGKEAVIKAFGTGLRGGALTDVEITNDELGAPQVKLMGHWAELAKQKNVTKIHLSLTHLADYAAAECILENLEAERVIG